MIFQVCQVGKATIENKFMDFMQKLGSGAIRLEGDTLVDAAGAAGATVDGAAAGMEAAFAEAGAGRAAAADGWASEFAPPVATELRGAPAASAPAPAGWDAASCPGHRSA